MSAASTAGLSENAPMLSAAPDPKQAPAKAGKGTWNIPNIFLSCICAVLTYLITCFKGTIEVSHYFDCGVDPQHEAPVISGTIDWPRPWLLPSCDLTLYITNSWIRKCGMGVLGRNIY